MRCKSDWKGRIRGVSTRGKSALWIAASIVAFVGIGAVILVRSNRPETPVIAGSVASVAPSSEDDTLRELQRFRLEREDQIRSRAVATARRDPGYRRNLLAITEEFILSMKGMTPARKKELWNRIRLSQDAVREMDLER